MQFDLAGLPFAGSACSPAYIEESAVLAAMGVDSGLANEFLRISFGPSTTEADVDAFSEWQRIAGARGKGRMIYLDYQATTPVAPEVARRCSPGSRTSSPTRTRRLAGATRRRRRSRSRASRSSKALGLKGGSVAFTGSATEALNWALKGTVEKARKGRNRIITVATEHAAVLDTCEWLAEQGIDLTILPVQPDGRLDLDLLERELDERVLLVSVMMVNNEIGVRSRSPAILEMVHKVGATMLSDAVQAFGRVRAVRRSRPGRGLGAQDPRSEESVRYGCARARSRSR